MADFKKIILQLFRAGDSSYQTPRMDSSTDTIQMIDYQHHEVHSGSSFQYYDTVEIDNGVTQDYLITTPNSTKWAHMLFELSGSGITQYELFEATDKTGTTAQTAYNQNRNSATTPTVTIHKGVSGGTTDGNRIKVFKGGSSSGQSRTSSTYSGRTGETILKANTKYILRITSGTNDNIVSSKLEWYEHTNIV